MAKSLKLAVFATGDLSLPTLDALVEAGHRIVALTTLPERPEEDEVLPEENEGAELLAWASDQGVDVDRPEEPGADDGRERLAAAEPDLGVKIAYGGPLPTSLLDVPRMGWIKVHFSALPKHRGTHPIRAAIWDGAKTTGVTVIEMTEEVDAGPILGLERIPLEGNETFGDLAPKLAELAPELAVKSVGALASGKKIKRRKQNERVATVSPVFSERHRKAPWWLNAKTVADHLRALSPEPGMVTMVQRQTVRILGGEPMNWVNAPMGEAGSYIGVRAGRLAVLCAEGTVFGIEHLHLPDESDPVSATDFAKAASLQPGSLFV
ncbi:MAG: methionyl-tRNA formyltransferase [Thermoanaerobaculia bacterium]|nr:methionyl-tRNA formyltransferase [Thermoanaerobaculia bacterium]